MTQDLNGFFHYNKADQAISDLGIEKKHHQAKTPRFHGMGSHQKVKKAPPVFNDQRSIAYRLPLKIETRTPLAEI